MTESKSTIEALRTAAAEVIAINNAAGQMDAHDYIYETDRTMDALREALAADAAPPHPDIEVFTDGDKVIGAAAHTLEGAEALIYGTDPAPAIEAGFTAMDELRAARHEQQGHPGPDNHPTCQRWVDDVVNVMALANRRNPSAATVAPDEPLRQMFGRALRNANAAAIPDTPEWQERMAEQGDHIIGAARALGIVIRADGRGTLDALTEHSDERYRPLMLAVRAADEAFEKTGDAGTKTWLDDYFLPELESHGLTLVILARRASEASQS